MIKGILFDKDGTLIEFEAMWHSIMTIVFEAIQEDGNLSEETVAELKAVSGYTSNGFEEESIIQYLPTSEIVQIWVATVANAGYDKSTFSNYFHRLFDLAALSEQVAVVPLDGVRDTLSYLRDKNYYLGVATADTEKSMKHSLSRAGLMDFFHFLGSDNGIHQGKPDPHMAEDFCRRVGIDRKELLIVGDSVNDRIFAENAEASFVGIINTYGAFNDGAEETVALIHSFPQLIEVMAL